MQKKALLALLIVAAITLSGCSLVVKDSAVDAKRVIIDVNGETVDKQTVNAQINSQLAYLQQMYYNYYGYTIDTTSETYISQATDTVVQSNIQTLVRNQKIKELGFDQFADEELAELTKTADEDYQSMIDTIKLLYLSGSTNEGDALTAEAEAYAKTNGYTKEYVLADAKATKAQERLKDSVVKDIAVSDEEVKADFDEKVAAAKTSYESNLSAYGSAFNGGSAVYYAPAGYRYVKQVLVKISAEDSTAISTLTSDLSTANASLTATKTALTENETALAAEGVTDEEKTALEEAKPALQTAVDEAQAKVDDLTKQLNEKTEAAFAAIKAEADEVYQKAAAGEDFEALIEQYNDDPGMTNDPGKTYGYAVCECYSAFETPFVETAMALKAVGDVAEPVKGSSGYFIIRYQGDVAEGEVALDTVAESIKSSLLTTKQDEAYDAALAGWVSAATVKTYADRLND